MWKNLLPLGVLAALLLLLPLACETAPFDPRGFRCETNQHCLVGYTCINQICEIALPSEEPLPESSEPSEPSEAIEPSEATENPADAAEAVQEQSQPHEAHEAPEGEPASEKGSEG